MTPGFHCDMADLRAVSRVDLTISGKTDNMLTQGSYLEKLIAEQCPSILFEFLHLTRLIFTVIGKHLCPDSSR